MALIPLFKWIISPLSSGKLFQRGGRSGKIIFLCKETWPKWLHEEILVRFYSQVFLTLSPLHSRYLEKYLSKVLVHFIPDTSRSICQRYLLCGIYDKITLLHRQSDMVLVSSFNWLFYKHSLKTEPMKWSGIFYLFDILI